METKHTEYTIVADSCCDLTPALKAELNAVRIPLTMRLGEKEFVDDDTLDPMAFLAEMKACKEKMASAAPAPALYEKAMEEAGNSFVVTLSSRLSASYANAVLAQTNAAAKTHVFDSKSASAGETRVALQIHDCVQKGMPFDETIAAVERFIRGMKTYFVLEDYDNLIKNGRMSKMTAKIATILNIKLIMGSDGDGNIKLYSKQLGTNKMLAKLHHFIAESGKNPAEERLVISHCNNPELGGRFYAEVKERYAFKQVCLLPSGGLSSLYTNDKGIVIAF
jgi:DegV family protein with EDD domain